MATNLPISWGTMSQSEATAAERTRTFLAIDATDGFTPETGLNYEAAASDVQISKNGGAFADATGVVTEVAVGVYKYVAAAAELDTIGEVTVKFEKAAARTVLAQIQVIAADLNVALATTTSLAAVATDVDNIEASTPPLKATGPHALGTLAANGNSTALGALHAYDTVFTVTGTWGGGTAVAQTCADVTATVPVWVTSGAGITANGTLTVTGPKAGVRVNLAGATSPSLVVTAVIRSRA